MPRTRFDRIANRPIVVPPPNYVAELMKRYMRAQKLTAADVGDKLGITGAAVSHALSRPASAWSIKELQKYCIALYIPLTDALRAVQKSLEASE